MRAKLGVVLQDGSWRYEYAVRSGADPLESHTLAEGRIENGKRAGKWSFYYSDGKRFMRGAYDSSGRREGLWLLWKPDGSLGDERFGLHCDGSRMAWRRPATTSCLALECPSSVQTQGRSSA